MKQKRTRFKNKRRRVKVNVVSGEGNDGCEGEENGEGNGGW